MNPARHASPPLDVLVYGDAAPRGAGALRTCRALAALGAQVRLLSVLGDDEESSALLSVVTRAGVCTRDVVRDPTRHSGSTGPVGRAVRSRLATRLHRWAPSADVVVVCDAGAGLLDARAVRTVASLRHPAVVVDSRTPMRWAPVAPRAVRTELADVHPLLGEGEDPAVRLIRSADAVLAALRTRTACVGTGGGALVLDREEEPRNAPDGADEASLVAGLVHQVGARTAAPVGRVIRLDGPRQKA